MMHQPVEFEDAFDAGICIDFRYLWFLPGRLEVIDAERGTMLELDGRPTTWARVRHVKLRLGEIMTAVIARNW